MQMTILICAILGGVWGGIVVNEKVDNLRRNTTRSDKELFTYIDVLNRRTNGEDKEYLDRIADLVSKRINDGVRNKN